MLREWGNNVAVEEPHEEIAADPRESKFELPPIEHAPFADRRREIAGTSAG